MFGLATIAGGESERDLGPTTAAGGGGGAAEAGTYIRGDPLLRRTVFLLRSDELDEEDPDEEDEEDLDEEEEPDELDDEDEDEGDGVGVLAFLDLAFGFALDLAFGLAFFDLAFALAFALARRDPFVAFFRRSSIFHSDPST